MTGAGRSPKVEKTPEMEAYLVLFEDAVNAQAEVVGSQTARQQAKKAGLTVSGEGHVVACTGNPMVVLLRLIRSFTEAGSLAALDACAPLISKLTELPAELERVGPESS
jgi:hypothetical protein